MKIGDHTYWDLTSEDEAAIRRFYRTVRIAVYANQAYTGPDRTCYQGCYGMSRDEAKRWIEPFAAKLSELTYLGSK